MGRRVGGVLRWRVSRAVTVLAMDVLTVKDPLPRLPRRVLVAGTSGAGKTTTALRLASLLGVEHIEIDALFHGPAWTRRTSFQADVAAFSSGPTWVTEWQYSAVQALLAERADTLIWLHFRRSTVMWRVTGRTLRRRLRSELLWNDNVEPPLRTIFTDRDHIIRCAWRTHTSRAIQVRQALREHPGLQIVELRSQHEVERWIAGPLKAALPLAGGNR